jgi:hypothetical protein
LFVRLPHFHGVALAIYSFELLRKKTCKLKKGGTCLFIYAECKDTRDVPRDPAGDLCSGSRGHFPIDNSWLSSLNYLSYSTFLTAFRMLVVYIVKGLLHLYGSFLWVRWLHSQFLSLWLHWVFFGLFRSASCNTPLSVTLFK